MPETKVVLISGANKGIGFETARQLTRRGWHVVIGARNPPAGQAAVSTITEAGGTASLLEIDVANSESIVRAAADYGKQFAQLDVLINNAGIYPDEGLNILTISREQLTATFQTNTFGPVAVTQAFLTHLRKAKGARIINVSSGYGQLEGLSASVPSYCLSKLTLNLNPAVGNWYSMRRELKHWGWPHEFFPMGLTRRVSQNSLPPQSLRWPIRSFNPVVWR